MEFINDSDINFDKKEIHNKENTKKLIGESNDIVESNNENDTNLNINGTNNFENIDSIDDENIDPEDDNKIPKEEKSFIDVYTSETDNGQDSHADDEFLLQAASYYSENYKSNKPNYVYGRNQLIVVSLIGSILGGLIVSGAFLIFQSGSNGSNGGFFKTVDYSKVNGSIKQSKIEIEKTDSPVSWIAKKVSPSIVGIKVTFKSSDLFFNDEKTSSEGSGIIIRSDGYILTNNHVITSTNKNEESKIEVTLPNDVNKKYEANIVGKDSKTDVAVLKIDVVGLYQVELGDDSNLKVGDMAIAIGNPGGLEYMGSVTVGVISGLNRKIPIADNTTLKLIQTDAAINPGNSGGALVNSEGKVIGMNTAKLSGVEVEGLGFAIPINEAKKIAENLIKYKYVKGRPHVGVIINPKYTEEYAKENGYPVGLLVDDVVPSSGAYNAGIRMGDLITKFDGLKAKDFSEFDAIKNKHKPGDKIKVEFYRNGKTIKTQVQLTEDKGEN